MQEEEIAKLIEDNVPFAERIVRMTVKMFPSHVDRDDLLGVGYLGLVEAAQRFDPEKGVKFETWAELRIRGAVLDYARKQDALSRGERKEAKKLVETTEKLFLKLNRQPTVFEIATDLQWPVGKVQDVQLDIKKAQTSSLEQKSFTGENQGETSTENSLRETFAIDTMLLPDAIVAEEEMVEFLRRGVDSLEERDQLVIKGLFFENRSMKDVAEECGVSVSRVAQIKNRAVDTLRNAFFTVMGQEVVSDMVADGDMLLGGSFFSGDQTSATNAIIDKMREARETGPPRPVPPPRPDTPIPKRKKRK